MKSILKLFIIMYFALNIACSNETPTTENTNTTSIFIDTIIKNNSDLRQMAHEIRDSIINTKNNFDSTHYLCVSFIGIGSYPHEWKDSLTRYFEAQEEQFRYFDSLAGLNLNRISFIICFTEIDSSSTEAHLINKMSNQKTTILKNTRPLLNSFSRVVKDHIPSIPSVYFVDFEGNLYYHNSFPANNSRLFKSFSEFFNKNKLVFN